jgi:hypothetical protein
MVIAVDATMLGQQANGQIMIGIFRMSVFIIFF